MRSLRRVALVFTLSTTVLIGCTESVAPTESPALPTGVSALLAGPTFVPSADGPIIDGGGYGGSGNLPELYASRTYFIPDQITQKPLYWRFSGADSFDRNTSNCLADESRGQGRCSPSLCQHQGECYLGGDVSSTYVGMFLSTANIAGRHAHDPVENSETGGVMRDRVVVIGNRVSFSGIGGTSSQNPARPLLLPTGSDYLLTFDYLFVARDPSDGAPSTAVATVRMSGREVLRITRDEIRMIGADAVPTPNVGAACGAYSVENQPQDYTLCTGRRTFSFVVPEEFVGTTITMSYEVREDGALVDTTFTDPETGLQTTRKVLRDADAAPGFAFSAPVFTAGTVVEENQPPIVSIDPATGTAGQPIILSATVSDADGTIASYAWHGGGDGCTLTPVSASTAALQCARPGTYRIAVIVADDSGAETLVFGTAVFASPVHVTSHDHH